MCFPSCTLNTLVWDDVGAQLLGGWVIVVQFISALLHCRGIYCIISKEKNKQGLGSFFATVDQDLSKRIKLGDGTVQSSPKNPLRSTLEFAIEGFLSYTSSYVRVHDRIP